MTDFNDNTRCNSNKIVSLDFLDREAALYKQSKESLKSNGEIIDKVIKKNTEKEVEEVQCAIKKLNEKVEAIMQTDFVKEKQTVIEASQEQMSSSIKKAYEAYFKVREYIIEKEGWWEQPMNWNQKTLWKFHAYAFSLEEGGAQIFTYHIDGDGDNDVITSMNARGYGLSWHEQISKNGNPYGVCFS